MKRFFYLSVIIFSLVLNANFAFANQFKVLVFTKTDGFHHKSINAGVTALEEMAKQHHFAMEWHEDARQFNDKKLQQFDVVLFLQTTANVLNEKQQAAMEKFIRSGKGFVGVHAAADTEYDWPWYAGLVGHQFKIHPTIQTAQMTTLNADFPGLEHFPAKLWWTEEWYDFKTGKSDNLNYLLTVDEQTYDPKADWGKVKTEGMGEFHPISWYHNYDGGRSFYTALGHLPETHNMKLFRDHLYGGIFWAATGRGAE